MIKLLQIEWMKIRNYKTFWILFILFIISIVGINFIAFYINTNISQTSAAVKALTGSPFDFPEIWKTIGWMTGWLLYFPGFIMIFLISNEFIFRTHRQNIIDGLSRKQFISVKLITALILASVCTLMMIITSLIFGFASGSGFAIGNFEYILYFFINSYIYIMMAVLLALLFRKAALSLGIYFIYGLIFDNLLSSLINSKTGTPIGTYLMPLQVSDSLFPIPFLNKILPNQPNVYILLIICTAWIVFYNWFPLKKFERDDL